MPPLVILLVVTILHADGSIDVETRPVPPYRNLTAWQVCQQTRDAYLTPPRVVPPEQQAELRDEAERRGAVCVAVPPGGRDS